MVYYNDGRNPVTHRAMHGSRHASSRSSPTYPSCSNSRLTRGGIGAGKFDVGVGGGSSVAAGAGAGGVATGAGDTVAAGTDCGMGT